MTSSSCPPSGIASRSAFGVVESTKAVVSTARTGEVSEVNDDLPDAILSLINEDPYGDGWMVKITLGDKADLGPDDRRQNTVKVHRGLRDREVAEPFFPARARPRARTRMTTPTPRRTLGDARRDRHPRVADLFAHLPEDVRLGRARHRPWTLRARPARP